MMKAIHLSSHMTIVQIMIACKYCILLMQMENDISIVKVVPSQKVKISLKLSYQDSLELDFSLLVVSFFQC